MRRHKARFFVWADTKGCCGVRWRSTSSRLPLLFESPLYGRRVGRRIGWAQWTISLRRRLFSVSFGE
ncbi:hypothetical protein [Pseudomonas sp. FG-3G]|nr:hypothetical protein [Pseudomonas sp. FG-3G]